MPSRLQLVYGLTASLLCSVALSQQPPFGGKPPWKNTSMDIHTPTGGPSDLAAYAGLVRMLPPSPANVPAPSPDPHNFEGTWVNDGPLVWRNTVDVYGYPIELTPKGFGILSRRIKAQYVDMTPYVHAGDMCTPGEQQHQFDINTPFVVYQNSQVMDFTFMQYHGDWMVRLNQPHRTSGPRQYIGDPVAHWDGDTLVVDVINYKKSWWYDFDGFPLSTSGHIVYRIRRIDYNGPKLEMFQTVDDPVNYTHTFSVVHRYAWRPDMIDFDEFDCESQVGIPGYAASNGWIPEPAEDDD